MHFSEPLIEGELIRRYKRFLADVRLSDGREVTAHTPNTGSMLGCNEPGSRVWLRESGSTTRKYPLSWELVQASCGTLVGINTGLSNALVREAIEAGRIRSLSGYDRVRPEVRYGAENSRIDLLLEDHGELPDCYLEVKNVTLARDGIGLFPDAVSTRGTKHLRELAAMAQQGARACLCFCVQRGDVQQMQPADDIDPEYGAALRAAIDQGVEVIAYRAEISPRAIHLTTAVPVVCPALAARRAAPAVT